MFQPKVYNGCHDMTQNSLNFNYVAVVTVARNYYRINFLGMN